MDRDMLLNRLTALDFMAVDLGLYLNTHPMEKQAIALYNKIIMAADTVRAKYEELYGPLCSFRSLNTSDTQWKWSDNPWPWESNFNFKISEEGCK